MSQPKPRERRRRRTKQAILDAASHIINQQGPAAVSMRGLAQAIDYSPAGLYEYFDSKEEIISEVCHQGHLRLTEYLSRVDTTVPVLSYLIELGLAYIDFAVNNADYFLLMFTTAAGEADAASEHEEGMEQILERMHKEGSSFPILLAGIQRAIEEGEFATSPERGLLELAYGHWAIVHGMAMLRVTAIRGVPLDYAKADRATLEVFNRGEAAIARTLRRK